MTTDNKYYTPSPGDFCEGLEYQFRYSENIRKCRLCGGDLMTKEGLVDGCVHGGSYVSNMDAYEWKDATFNVVDGLGDDDFEKEYRVKYLDREDIEECGWKYGSWSYTEGSQLIMTKAHYNLFYSEQTKTLSITDSTRSANEGGRYYHYQLFEGIINNKSELKKLMKQLNINE